MRRLPRSLVLLITAVAVGLAALPTAAPATAAPPTTTGAVVELLPLQTTGRRIVDSEERKRGAL